MAKSSWLYRPLYGPVVGIARRVFALFLQVFCGVYHKNFPTSLLKAIFVMMGACKAHARVPFTYSLLARNTATASRVSWAYTPENDQKCFSK